MRNRILITGGAGFIGSHLADDLLARGHHVRVLDDLSPQVHGPNRRRPDYLDSEVELIVGDVRDTEAVGRNLKGIDAVVHLAARVGVGSASGIQQRVRFWSRNAHPGFGGPRLNLPRAENENGGAKVGQGSASGRYGHERGA